MRRVLGIGRRVVIQSFYDLRPPYYDLTGHRPPITNHLPLKRNPRIGQRKSRRKAHWKRSDGKVVEGYAWIHDAIF